MKKRAKKKPGRRKPVAKLAREVCATLGAKPGTPEVAAAVRSFNEWRSPGWWALHRPSGVDVYVGEQADRWFDCRASAVRMLTEKTGRPVCQDAVLLVWADAKPNWDEVASELVGSE